MYVVVVLLCGRGGEPVVVDDFFWRPHLLIGSILVDACYCLHLGC